MEGSISEAGVSGIGPGQRDRLDAARSVSKRDHGAPPTLRNALHVATVGRPPEGANPDTPETVQSYSLIRCLGYLGSALRTQDPWDEEEGSPAPTPLEIVVAE